MVDEQAGYMLSFVFRWITAAARRSGMVASGQAELAGMEYAA